MLRDIESWFLKRVPAAWFAGAPAVTADAEEVVVVGELPLDARGDASEPESLEAIKRFREASREQRIRIATEAEARFGRHVTWGARCGGVEMIFTSHSTPVMTRLRMAERGVLDTLIAAGVARTRSDALAWCVRLVGEHEADWLGDLREALVRVGEVRAAGPQPR